MYMKRAIKETVVTKISAVFPVLLVTGPRRVGKTTFLQKLSSPERKYVTSLAGRVGIVSPLGLSDAEIHGYGSTPTPQSLLNS